MRCITSATTSVTGNGERWRWIWANRPPLKEGDRMDSEEFPLVWSGKRGYAAP